ncbi:oxidoreductase [Thalassobacillus devorans]|uniref:Oxidoreductase n=1 Tax=Thalassobacillus devorans TaxID=279813 RepID=A0ABQ1NTE8_9BACI|nr:Gfo/Idh/MocA family oxidoreductase [Thalassobacillus devorans]NIK28679.1 putative dehydrogenase [Thalassobacillus devorans]GGC84369.1 oxidoreductase [Thalassobacillus devorans]
MEKKKVAIIGGGQVAETKHISNYQDFDDIEIVAVLCRREASACAFAERNGIARAYTDLSDLLAVEKPDMVSVCTPNKFHLKHVTEALKSGSHVLCEKPPGISSQEAKAMHELAESRGLVLAYNFQHRVSEAALTLKEKVQEGMLGDVYYAKLSALRRSGVPGWGNFINKELQGGGPLIDIGIHMLDSAFFILGFPEVKKVTAKMFQKIGPFKEEGSFGSWNPDDYEVEDALFGFIELANGGLIQVDTSFALHMKQAKKLNIELCGDKAGATLYPLEIYTDDKGELVTLLEQESSDDPERTAIHSFVRKCAGSTSEVIATGEEGYKVQQLVELLYKSAEQGETIYL